MALPLVAALAVIGGTALVMGGAFSTAGYASRRKHRRVRPTRDEFEVWAFPDWWFELEPLEDRTPGYVNMRFYFREEPIAVDEVQAPAGTWDDWRNPTLESTGALQAITGEYAEQHDAELRFSELQTTSVEPIMLEALDGGDVGGYPGDFWGYKIYRTDNGVETQILWGPDGGDSRIVAAATHSSTPIALGWAMDTISKMAAVDWGRLSWEERGQILKNQYRAHFQWPA